MDKSTHISVCWTGLQDLPAYSLLGGFVPIPEQRLGRSLDSVPLILVYYFLPSDDGYVPPPPLTPSPRVTRVPCAVQFACILSLFFLCLLSVRVCSVGRPPPAASGHSASVRRKSTTLRLTADQCPLLVSCPASRMKVCPPTCAAGGTWLGCGWRGRRRRRPPRWS